MKGYIKIEIDKVLDLLQDAGYSYAIIDDKEIQINHRFWNGKTFKILEGKKGV